MTGFSNRMTALAITALYVVIVAFIMLFFEVDINSLESLESHVIVMDLTEPEIQPEIDIPSRPSSLLSKDTPVLKSDASVASDNAERPRTVNQRALFRMNSEGKDQSVDAGNENLLSEEKLAADGDDSGNSLVGNSMLDAGLAGRGLVGDLPIPEFPDGSRGGVVVIRVSVDSSGCVTSALYEAKGSTTSSAILINAAKNAALKAKFQESSAMVEGGTITYYFRIR